MYFFFKPAVLVKEFLMFSTWMRFVYLFLLLITIGFVVPVLIDQLAWQDVEMDTHIVRGTCHIEVGMRTDCMPERDSPSEVNFPFNHPFPSWIFLPLLHTLYRTSAC